MTNTNVDSGLAVRVIDRVSVTADGDDIALQAGQRQLVALLVAAGPNGATPDRLADEIWAEQLPMKWKNSLRVAVSRLRRRTGLPITFTGGSYRLNLDPVEVDLWRLFEVADEDVVPDDELESLLSDPCPFPLVEPTPSLVQISGRAVAAQRQLIERLADREVTASRRFLSLLVAHLADDASDDRLVAAIAKIHHRSGASAVALGLIERCRRDLQENFGAELSSDLRLLEQQIRDSGTVPEARRPVAAARTLPAPLQRYRADRLIGRASEVEQLQQAFAATGRTVTVLRGPAGSGKTALLAELAHRTPDAHIVYFAGVEGGSLGLDPLTSAVTGFGQAVEEVNRLDLDSAGRMGVLATRLLEVVTAQAANRRVVLLVDDAHWLDSLTCELLSYFLRAGSADRIEGLVLAARDERRKSPWTGLEQTLDRALPVSEISLNPLGAADIEKLVAAVHPDLSLTARSQMAEHVRTASAGLPAVAHRMLEAGLTSLDSRPAGTDVFDRVVDSIDDQVKDVAVGAAVLGRSFRTTDLTNLLRRSDETVYDAIDVLIQSNLVVETGSLDRFEFSHQLLVEALLRSMSQLKRARLHRAACGRAADVHDRARHQVASGELIEVETRLAAVLASARAHLRDREYWESAAEFRIAIGLEGADLRTEDYVDFAQALSLSGARRAGLTIRERAFDAAAAERRWGLALEAACSGLPEAEVPDGEEDRLAKLEAIPGSALSSAERLKQSLTAARLASQLGRPAEAKQWADRAAAAATSEEGRGEAALCERFVRTVDMAPARRLERLSTVLADTEPSLSISCRTSQFRAVDQLELGRLDLAEAEHRTFQSLARELNDPVRQWHALIFDSLLQEATGQLTTADQLADEAQDLGKRYGIAQAEIVRIGQMGFRLELMGQLGSLAGMIGEIPVSDADSMLFAAARVRVLDAAGQSIKALDAATGLAEMVLERPSVTSHGVIGLVAPTLRRSSSADLRNRSRAALEPFRGGAMVLGVGLGMLPSVDFLFEILDAGSAVAYADSLQRAIDHCDRHSLRSWSIRYRCDLAKLTGSDQALAEAETLAAGTDLMALFAKVNLAA